MRIPAVLIAIAFLGSMRPVHAQDRKEPKGPTVYKVEFEVRDGSNGEAQPSQHFSMLIDESRKGVFKAANRVPVATGSPQYVDVGVNIECTVVESDGKAALAGAIELSSIDGQVLLGTMSQPIIGQRKIAFNTTLELGTRALITNDRSLLAAPEPGMPATSGAIGATRQVEATVTKLN